MHIFICGGSCACRDSQSRTENTLKKIVLSAHRVVVPGPELRLSVPLSIAPSSLQPYGAIAQSHIAFFLEGKICHLQLGIFLRIHNADWLAPVRLWTLESENGLQGLCYHPPTQKFLCWTIFSGSRADELFTHSSPTPHQQPWHSPP